MSIPTVPVFHSEHNCNKIDIFADRNGFRINFNNDDVVIYTWEDWILQQARNEVDYADIRGLRGMWHFWIDLASALPLGDHS